MLPAPPATQECNLAPPPRQEIAAIESRKQQLEGEISVLRQEMSRLQTNKQATDAKLLETRRTVKVFEQRLVRAKTTVSYQLGNTLVQSNASWKGLLRLPARLLGVYSGSRVLRRTSKKNRDAGASDIARSTEAVEFIRTALHHVEQSGGEAAARWAKANTTKPPVLAYALMEIARTIARDDPQLAVALGTEAIHLYPIQQRVKALAFLLGEHGHVRPAVSLIEKAVAASAHFNTSEAKIADHLRALGRLLDAPPVVPAPVRRSAPGLETIGREKRMVVIGQQAVPFDVSAVALRLQQRARGAATAGWTATVITPPGYPSDIHGRHTLADAGRRTEVDGVAYVPLAPVDQPEEVADLYQSAVAASFASAAVAAHACLIQADATPIYGVAAALAARSIGCPLVLDFDDLMDPHEAYAPGLERSEKAQALLGLLLIAARAADVCRVHHPNVLRLLESAGIARDRLHYAPYRFTDPLPAAEDVAALAREIGVGGGPVIGVVRDLCDSYDTAVLADLLATLAPEVAGLQLLVVGQGRGGDGLKKRAAELKVSGALVFIDKPDPQRMDQYRALMDVTVFTRRDTPRAALLGAYEVQAALAGGGAVVAYRTADAREIIEDGATGLLCKPDDISELRYKVLSLLEQPALRRALGDAAREAARAAASATPDDPAAGLSPLRVLDY
jgi:Glycosyl transferases group 1